MKLEGTQSYVATDDLKLAVNAAITLQRPLLVKGEPGTGKTMLAEQLAESFGAKLITWHIKSTTKAHQGLYDGLRCGELRLSRIRSWAWTRFTTCATTSRRASSGRPSRPRRG